LVDGCRVKHASADFKEKVKVMVVHAAQALLVNMLPAHLPE
jgi:hypothetical protein